MNIPADFSFDQKCSKFFRYKDFFECSDTYKKNDCLNLPQQEPTLFAIRSLAVDVLDKVCEKFGELHLTYGFCSMDLSKLVPRNIDPRIDQHAGHEIKRNGKPICDRLGFASDFFVPSVSSLVVARYIVSELPFDRLYYYGDASPIHVSLSSDPIRQIVLMPAHKNRRIPKVITEQKFLKDAIPFSGISNSNI